LTNNVYLGRKALLLINKPNITAEQKIKLQEQINLGRESETIVINYTDTLLTAMNPCDNPKETQIPELHPCTIDAKSVSDEDLNTDYEDIVNC